MKTILKLLFNTIYFLNRTHKETDNISLITNYS